MSQIQCHFYSRSLRHGTDIFLDIPSMSPCDMKQDTQPTHVLSAKFPILYMLHGSGNDYMCWPYYTSMVRQAEEKRIAICTVNGANQSFVNVPGAESYYDFIEYELPEFLQAYFPISSRKEDTYIAGLSMGGRGTLIHALTSRNHFAAAGAFSPGLHIDGAYSNDKMVQLGLDALRENGSLPKLFMSCGDRDFLFPAVQDFYQKATEAGIPIDYKVIPDYEHEWRLWDVELPRFLDWLPRTDEYVKLGYHKI